MAEHGVVELPAEVVLIFIVDIVDHTIIAKTSQRGHIVHVHILRGEEPSWQYRVSMLVLLFICQTAKHGSERVLAHFNSSLLVTRLRGATHIFSLLGCCLFRFVCW